MQSEGSEEGRRHSDSSGYDGSAMYTAAVAAGSELRSIFRDFLNMEPTSMLIRGLPGAGKTTLALELMQLMHEKYNCFYISTRVSLARLQRYFPWIIGYLKDESVLSYDKIERDSVIDLRLGSAAGTVELVIDTLINRKRALVVLDSWDALAKEIKHEDRMKMEKTMITVADTNDGFLLFVSEEPEMNTLSYLVDGIVTLGVRDDGDGVRIRSMHIDKMRGVALHNNTYAYTLLDSRFIPVPISRSSSMHCECRGCGDDDGGGSRSFHTIHAKDGFLSMGNTYMDGILHGGLRYGSTLLLEIDPGLDMVFLKAILVCMVLNTLNSKRKVLFDALDAPLSSILSSIIPFCTDEVKNLTIFSLSKIDTARMYEQWLMLPRRKDGRSVPNTLPLIVNINESNYSSSILAKYEEMKRMERSGDSSDRDRDRDRDGDGDGDGCVHAGTIPSRPILIILDNMYASNSKRYENMLLTNAKDNGDVAVIIERVGSGNIPYAKSISDVHLRLWGRNGVNLMHAVKPTLGTYAILLDGKRGYPAYSLLRMV
ncbi:MAG: hypothetical protein NZ888_06705 [Candidatus Nitrosocaldus sp.]|nr:hypothetical protein [Candidatus Nitrosocaldus sp.]MDW8000373.1 gas vesicle protein GvpD P-loop domain-containing protein [Candidatus Nitrosocaldus sp.]